MNIVQKFTTAVALGAVMVIGSADANKADAAIIQFNFSSSDLVEEGTTGPAIPVTAIFELDSEAQNTFPGVPGVGLYEIENTSYLEAFGTNYVLDQGGQAGANRGLSSDSAGFRGENGSISVRIDLGDGSAPFNLVPGVLPMDLANLDLAQADTARIRIEANGVRYEGTVDEFAAFVASIPEPHPVLLAAMGALISAGFFPRLMRKDFAPSLEQR